MSGVLLFGPPGTGKTLLAKAVAHECAAAFHSVKGPELLDKFIGQSEANVRRVFRSARAAAPCVVFFDELDALAPARGTGADSGGVSDRVVSALLAELDTCSQQGGPLVFVLGATNRPDLLDRSLLRPGRFDRRVYIGPLTTPAAQQQVLSAQLRQIQCHAEVPPEAVQALLPPVCTGADIRGLLSSCATAALLRCAGRLETQLGRTHASAHRGNSSGSSVVDHPRPSNAQAWSMADALPPADITPLVTMLDVRVAAGAMQCSVSQRDLARYDALRREMASSTLQLPPAATVPP
jgi:peroxin-6